MVKRQVHQPIINNGIVNNMNNCQDVPWFADASFAAKCPGCAQGRCTYFWVGPRPSEAWSGRTNAVPLTGWCACLCPSYSPVHSPSPLKLWRQGDGQRQEPSPVCSLRQQFQSASSMDLPLANLCSTALFPSIFPLPLVSFFFQSREWKEEETSWSDRSLPTSYLRQQTQFSSWLGQPCTTAALSQHSSIPPRTFELETRNSSMLSQGAKKPLAVATNVGPEHLLTPGQWKQTPEKTENSAEVLRSNLEMLQDKSPYWLTWEKLKAGSTCPACPR